MKSILRGLILLTTMPIWIPVILVAVIVVIIVGIPSLIGKIIEYAFTGRWESTEI